MFSSISKVDTHCRYPLHHVLLYCYGIDPVHTKWPRKAIWWLQKGQNRSRTEHVHGEQETSRELGEEGEHRPDAVIFIFQNTSFLFLYQLKSSSLESHWWTYRVVRGNIFFYFSQVSWSAPQYHHSMQHGSRKGQDWDIWFIPSHLLNFGPVLS